MWKLMLAGAAWVLAVACTTTPAEPPQESWTVHHPFATVVEVAPEAVASLGLSIVEQYAESGRSVLRAKTDAGVEVVVTLEAITNGAVQMEVRTSKHREYAHWLAQQVAEAIAIAADDAVYQAASADRR